MDVTSAFEPFRDEHPGKPAVRGFIHRAANTCGGVLILSHAAASDCDAPLLVALAQAFSASGITVLRCDLPFRQMRPKGRPSAGVAARDQAGLRRAVDLLKAQVCKKIYLGGLAYGGRQSSLLAASEPGLVDGLLLLSYPLHPPGQRGPLRTFHFPSVRTPALFVQASRDPFGTPDEVRPALELIAAPTRLVIAKDARHDLFNDNNRETLPRMIVSEFEAFFGEEKAKASYQEVSG